MILAGDWSPGAKAVKLDLNHKDDFYIANLEGPILKANHNYSNMPKAGPYLCNNHVPDKNFIFMLANNHTMDYGNNGLSNTLEYLNLKNIKNTGAGVNIEEASRELIIEQSGVRFGILSRCETQFGVASLRRPGVAPLDDTVYLSISRLRKKVDIVIVSVHGASEMSPWPSPYWQDKMRAFIDAGADIVHGHHSHIPQGYENYNNGIIFYGMGNFCVDKKKWQQYPNALWSIIVELKDNNKFFTEIMTITIDEANEGLIVRESSERELIEHFNYLKKCNYPLADRELLIGLWQENSIRLYNLYYPNWLGFQAQECDRGVRQDIRSLTKKIINRFFRKDFDKISKAPSCQDLLLLYHLFACESHKDAISTALGVMSGELEDYRTNETTHLVDEMMPWSKEIL